MEIQIDQKRIQRIKRSKVLQIDCKGIASPSIEWAESPEDLRQSFSLVHREYLRLGYLKEPHPSGLFFGIHSLLPETVTLVVKSESKVVATLTQVPDTADHGLPMDTLFKRELDTLRRKGRKTAELCALVTSPELRWKNLYMQMTRIMYRHALCNGINDFCIMVNPKHVEFYKLIFMFEQLGPEKHYPVLGVPAVALRADLNLAKQRFHEKYGWSDTECNLHDYLHKSFGDARSAWAEQLEPPVRISPKTRAYFSA